MLLIPIPTRTADASTTRTTADLELEPWKFLWLLTVDVYLLRVALGRRLLAVPFLGLCHVRIINVGKLVQRQRAPEDRGVNDTCRRAATAVLAASVAKVAAVGVVLGVQLAAISLASLCVTTALLLVWEESLLADMDDASGGVVSGAVEGARGSAGNILGGAWR